MHHKNNGRNEKMKDLPRGLRNKNPGNIVAGDPWQGLDIVATNAEGRFCVFNTYAHGIRAMARIIITYQEKRKAPDGSGIDTVQKLINRWAPKDGHIDGDGVVDYHNPSVRYAAYVRERAGFEPGQQFNCHSYSHMKPIIQAMCDFENANLATKIIPDADFDRGLLMAGIEKPAKAVRQSKEIQAGVGAAGLVGAGAITEYAEDLPTYGLTWLHTIQSMTAGLPDWVLPALAVGAIGLFIYYRWQKSRRGYE